MEQHDQKQILFAPSTLCRTPRLQLTANPILYKGLAANPCDGLLKFGNLFFGSVCEPPFFLVKCPMLLQMFWLIDFYRRADTILSDTA